MSRTRSKGFSLRDLLVLIAVLVVIVGLFLPALLRRMYPISGRVVCASNLRVIGQALLLYTNDNRGRLPRVTYDPAAPPTAFTGATAANPFAPDGPAPNDVTASLYLLARTQDIDLTVFNCDKAWHTPMPLEGRPVTGWSNFPSGHHLSYSFANLYFDLPTTGREADAIGSAEFAIAADINPGTPELLAVTPPVAPPQRRRINSPNHEGDGQNVLYGDGHVSFEPSPFVGINHDNIYTFGPSGDRAGDPGEVGIVGKPIDTSDSILLPVATPPPPASPAHAVRVLLILLALIVFAVAVWYTLHRRQFTNTPSTP